MSFENVKDQPDIVSMLTTALAKNHLSHGLLFAGPADSGQREAALGVAQVLLCNNRKGAEACGICPSCRQSVKAAHPDLVILASEDETSAIKVEEIRNLISRANLKPFQSPSKVFIIERAESMNETAQNALLKTLEEPAAFTYFILLANAAEKLLPTIRSRSQMYHFLPHPVEITLDAEEESAKNAILGLIAGRNEAPDISGYDRSEICKILDVCLAFLRDALLIHCGSAQLVGASSDKHEKEKMSKALDIDGLLDALEVVSETREKISQTINVKLALTVLWDSLAARKAGTR